MIENPHYQVIIDRHKHLKEVDMEDKIPNHFYLFTGYKVQVPMLPSRQKNHPVLDYLESQ